MTAHAETRLKWFKIHLAGYAVVVALLAVVNVLAMPDRPWFVILMVGWGAPLAIHCAFAMGLFGERRS